MGELTTEGVHDTIRWSTPTHWSSLVNGLPFHLAT